MTGKKHQSPLPHTNWPKVLAASKSYHELITTNIIVNRAAILLLGNTGKYDGSGSTTAQEKSGRGQFYGFYHSFITVR
jgi:hypothetical protein